MADNIYDVFIVGGGIAGLTAAIYTTRKKLKTLVASIDIGGQTLLTNHIENYPGYTGSTGPGLIQIVEEQARKFGAEIIGGKVTEINKNEFFEVVLSNGEKYLSKTILLAYGKVPKSLDVPGEQKFIGRGVSTCATCDAPIFAGKTVAVIGGGNSALEAAILAAGFSEKVYIVHRRDEFRGDGVLVDKVKSGKKIELILNSFPVEIKGDKFVEVLVVSDANNSRRELKVDGIFVEIGYEIKTDFVKTLVKINERNEIVINNICETSFPGIFAAGDVTITPYKQAIVSASEGAIAGLSVYNYIQRMEGKTEARADWGK